MNIFKQLGIFGEHYSEFQLKADQLKTVKIKPPTGLHDSKLFSINIGGEQNGKTHWFK